ncbi:MAG TPA: hypothetical protein VEV83_21815 [Parafilimonas sp.]|nr:hypothetical protein [Parafilimonas sp.]
MKNSQLDATGYAAQVCDARNDAQRIFAGYKKNFHIAAILSLPYNR